MSVPWLKRLSGRAEVKYFPPTNAPVMFLLPNRAGVPIYGQPQPTVTFMQPPEPPLPPPPAPRPPVQPISVTYWNTSQTCVNTCPEGTTGEPIEITVPANTYSSEVSQEAANAAALAAACAEAAALREDNPCTEVSAGSLWAMGWNDQHQLGVGDTLQRYSPVIVEEEEPSLAWNKIVANETFSVGLKADGSLWTWGGNYEGELGNGNRSVFPATTFDQFRPTQIGSDSWVDISVGSEFVIAIKSDGTLWTWGYNWAGQLGQGSTTSIFSPTQVGSDNDWVQVYAGSDHSLAIKSGGTAWSAGRNNLGQLGRSGDTLVFLQIGSDSNWAYLGAGLNFSLGIRTDGTLWTIADAFNGGIVQVGTDTDWSSVKGGANYQIAQKTDGTLWGWGNNDAGQLGVGDLLPRTDPTQISADVWTDYSVSYAAGHTLGIKSDGTFWGWGNNTYGQLGQGSSTLTNSLPIQIGPDDLWLKCGSGYIYSFGTRSTTTPPPPSPGSDSVAIGGSYVELGGYSIHTFTGSGTFSVLNGAGVLFDVLIVGGGGGGGGFGGGGGGEVSYQTGLSLTDTDYAVVVGGRGTAGGSNTQGGNGGDSSFNATTALGGGGGGAYGPSGAQNGLSRATGGGGGVSPNLIAGTGGTGASGGDGGDGSYSPSSTPLTGGDAGGGGGGAGGNGANGSSSTGSPGTGVGGAGGVGTSNSITGSAIIYGAGGGGGGKDTGGAGGSSNAGGAGADGNTEPGSWGLTPGSGGGGGAYDSLGGLGSLGIVIIRYLTP